MSTLLDFASHTSENSFSVNFDQVPRKMSVTQHIFSIVASLLLSFFKVASSSKDSLLVRKNTIRGITKRVQLRNVVISSHEEHMELR